MKDTEKQEVIKEFTSRGGKAKLAKYGPQAFAEMGKKGSIGKLKKYGPNYYKNIRRIGVEKARSRAQAKEQLSKKNSPLNSLAKIFS